MVNRKGWIRIIEATICAVLIIMTVLIYAQDNNVKHIASDYSDIDSILDEMVKEKDMRADILTAKLGTPDPNINSALITRIKRSGIEVNNTICDINRINTNSCDIQKPQGVTDIDVYERVLSTDEQFGSYDLSKARILKVIVFQGK